MNYVDLLRKYMAYVDACEGTDFVENGYCGYSGDPTFTREEWALLKAASKENERAREHADES